MSEDAGHGSGPVSPRPEDVLSPSSAADLSAADLLLAGGDGAPEATAVDSGVEEEEGILEEQDADGDDEEHEVEEMEADADEEEEEGEEPPAQVDIWVAPEEPEADDLEELSEAELASHAQPPGVAYVSPSNRKGKPTLALSNSSHSQGNARIPQARRDRPSHRDRDGDESPKVEAVKVTMSQESNQRGSDDCACLLCVPPRAAATFALTAAFATSAIVLHRKGPGEGSRFDADVTGLFVVISTGVPALLIFLFQLMVTCVTRSKINLMEWALITSAWLQAMGVVMSMLAMLAHAPWLLVQSLAVVAAFCWVLWCSSFSFWLWRKGVPTPPSGEPPLGNVLLVLPRRTLFAFWLITLALEVGTMHFKDREHLGFTEELGILEILVYHSIGGLMISFVIVALLFSVFPMGRRLLRFRKLPGYGWQPVRGLEVVARAFVMSFALHLYSAMFLSVLAYALIAAGILCMARMALPPQDGEPPWRCCSKRRKSAPVAPMFSPASDGGHSISSWNTHSMSVDSSVDKALAVEEKEAQERIADLRKHQPKDVVKQLWGWGTTSAMISLALVKVVLLVLIFLFDLVFLERYIADAASRNYVLVRKNAECGTRGELLSSFTMSAKECALYVGMKGPAFLYEPSGRSTTPGKCYLVEDISVGQHSYDIYTSGGVHECPGGGNFTVAEGFDFYVMEPTQECAYTGRFLADAAEGEEQFTTQPSSRYQLPLLVPEGMGVLFGDWLKEPLDAIMWGFRYVVNLKFFIPEAVSIQCVGLRRLAAGCMIFGAVLALLAVQALDLFSIMAASKEIATTRAQSSSSFVVYILTVAKATALEEAVVMALQLTVSAGVTAKQEAIAFFDQDCGNLVTRDHLKGSSCPVFWHIPIDIVATALLFGSLFFLVLIVLGTFGGAFYGWEPARWAMRALFGSHLQMAQYLPVGEDQLRTLPSRAGNRTTRPNCCRRCCQFLLRALAGLPATFGVWFQRPARVFQIKERQEWYEPVQPHDKGDVVEQETQDLVSWGAMFTATSRSIAIAWLPMGRMGPLISKACIYFNTYVVLAFGKDNSEDAKPLYDHFRGDRSRMSQIIYWGAMVSQFLITVIIQFDLIEGIDEAERVYYLAGMLAFVIFMCVVRVLFDLVEDLIQWTRARSTIEWCEAMVVGDTPKRVIRASNGIRQWQDDDEDPLDGLCEHKRAEVIQVCRDLLELDWVRNRAFLTSKKVLLDTASKRQGLRGYSARRMLKLFNAGKGNVKEGMVTASMLIYFRICLDQEICIARARRAAEQMAYAHWLSEAKLRSGELARWACDRARAQVLRLAKERLKSFADFREAEGAKDTIWPASCPRELHLCYSATFGGVIRGTGQWTETDRDLMPRIEERVFVRTSGEVVIEWPRNQKPGNLSIGQVRVKQTNTQLLDNSVNKWGEAFDAGVEAAPPPPPKKLKTKAAIGIERLRLQCAGALQIAKVSGALEAAIKEFEAEQQALDAPVVDEDHCWLTQWERDLKSSQGCCRGCCVRGSFSHNVLKSGETRMLDQTERWRVQVAVDWDGVGGPWTSNPKLPGKAAGSGKFFAAVDEDESEHYDDPREEEDRFEDGNLMDVFLGQAGWTTSSFPPEPNWTASTGDETLQKHEDMQNMQEWIQRTPNAPRLLYIAHVFLNRASRFERIDPVELESAAQARKASQYALFLAFHVELVRRRRKRKELEAKFQPPEEDDGPQAAVTTVVSGPLIVKQASTKSKLGGLFKATRSLVHQASAARMPEAGPLEELREALARQPMDADELQSAIEAARRVDVDPVLLQRAEEALAQLLERQSAAMKLVEAIHCRTIRKLREGIGEAKILGFEEGEFPDRKGRGILHKARTVLQEEERSARRQLKEALANGGVVVLQRAVEQARAANIDGRLLKEAELKLERIGNKKKRIALLKMAISANNYSMLRDVVMQCEEAGDDDVDLRQAKRRLKVLEAANRNFQESMKRAHERDADIAAALQEVSSDEEAAGEKEHPMERSVTLEELAGVDVQAMKSVRDLSLSDINSSHNAAKRVRAVSSLKAALFQEPLDLGILRMAVAQAEAAGVKNADFNQAKELLSIEEAKGDVLDRLHRCSSVRDVAGLKDALRECKKVQVEDAKLLQALTQLFNDQARIARLAGDHGLSNIFLSQIEQERCFLHNRIQEASGGLRVFCRIRPLGPLEGRVPLVTRQDRHTIVVKSAEQVAHESGGGHSPSSRLMNRGMTMGLSSSRAGKSNVGQSQEQCFRFNAVFGPDAIQAEVFDELKGLCQSAVDGYNVLIVGCGPVGGGKTYTMMGSPHSNQKRGIAPRIADEIFAIRDRDEWRASLTVEVQAVEILDHKEIVDLLGFSQQARLGVTVRLASAEPVRPSTSGGPVAAAAAVSFAAPAASPQPMGPSTAPSGDSGTASRGLQVRGARGGSHLQFAGAAAVLPRASPPPSELGLAGGSRWGLPAAAAATTTGSFSRPSSSARPRSAAGCRVELDASFKQVAGHLELRAVIEQALRSRTRGGRSRSSSDARSHFLVFIHLTRTNKATGATTRSRIVLADMAGLSSSSSLEGMSAYQAVESVLTALNRRSRMVPFREHALTQCFQDCMGGSSKTVMMLELPPDAGSVPDSLRAIQSMMVQ